MIPDWKLAEKALRDIEVIGYDHNQPVTISGYAEGLSCVGIGTDAAVFRYNEAPDYVYKVYSAQALEKKELEEDVYKRLKGSSYFPQFFGSGINFIVLSFEEGQTLYDCLIQGIPIPQQAIEDVEDARAFVRSLGLNPRDIHLKNILLQNGRGKVLDVSEYIQKGNDNRWELLVWAYQRFYPLISGVRMPVWILKIIKYMYYRIDSARIMLRKVWRFVSRLIFRTHK